MESFANNIIVNTLPIVAYTLDDHFRKLETISPTLVTLGLVSSPDPTLEQRKGLVTLGKKLDPVDDPRRNLHVPIRLQL